MAEITWTITANDYQYGQVILNMNKDGTTLHLERPYEYLTPDRELKPIYLANTLVQDIPWASIPPDVQATLTFIDTYTKDQIRIQVENRVSGSPL